MNTSYKFKKYVYRMFILKDVCVNKEMIDCVDKAVIGQ